MKLVVRLAILVVALLMISSVAFAVTPINCTGDQVVCYHIIATWQNGTSSSNDTYKFCLNDDGTGGLCIIGEGCYDYLKVFGGGTGWFNFAGDPPVGGNPNWTIWVANGSLGGFSGFFQPIGEGNLLTGVITWFDGSPHGGIINGTKVKCP